MVWGAGPNLNPDPSPNPNPIPNTNPISNPNHNPYPNPNQVWGVGPWEHDRTSLAAEPPPDEIATVCYLVITPAPPTRSQRCVT